MPVRNQFLRALPHALFDDLKARLRPMEFPVGRTLFRANDRIGTLYFLDSGAISLVLELASGQMIESAMIGHDSVVGAGAALDDREAMYKAIVQIGGQGHALDIDAARQLVRDSEDFRLGLVRHEQLVLAQAQQSAACNAVHNLNERLARWLLRVRDVTGSDSFTLTQEFIAEMLGVGRTSVSIVAHTFQQSGLIRYQRGHITIENLEGLRDAACECYATVKSHYDRLLQSQRT